MIVTLRLEKVTKNYAVYSDATTGFGKLYLPLEEFGAPGITTALPQMMVATLAPAERLAPAVTV